MKHIKTFLESKLTKELQIDEINSFCKFNGIRQYNITPDLKLDVDGYVDIEDMGLGVMPVKFGKIVGTLRCGGNKLKDFNNFPDELIGNLYASKNNFKSLEGMPSIHGTTIDLSYNKITSMKGIEKQIANNIILTGNKISEIDTNLSGFRDSTFLMDENPIYYIPSEYATKINILSNIPYMKLIGRLYDDYFRPTKAGNRLFHDIDDFEVIKKCDKKDNKISCLNDTYMIDMISLNSLFDFYNIEFNHKELEKLAKRFGYRTR